ncbi:TolB family protein [Kitasatospora sp. NPDC091335]|uniref:TolB family protein n=1 Tax=Kitasatospora sp. NPDC091335 TaxID=3364085 RepID=UPI0037F16E71
MTTTRTRRRLARTAAVLLATAVAVAAMPAAQAKPPKGDPARVSETTKGEQLDGYSSGLGLSEDGRSALFRSAATNLLPEPGTPNSDEVYVRNLRNGHVERISVAPDGSRLNAPTADASISGDGRYVAFSTSATNVLPGQAAHQSDVFVRDRWTGRTELVTVGGVPGAGDQSLFNATSPSISRDGRYVAYVSNRSDLVPDPNVRRGKNNIYVTDRWTRTSRLVTVGADGDPASDNSSEPSISADGATIAFTSRAGNLLPDDPATSGPGSADPGSTDPGSGPGTEPGTGSPELASGPRYYSSYVWKADTGRIAVASLDGTGQRAGSRYGRISPDGRYAVYSLAVRNSGLPGHGSVRLDVYIHELATGKVTKINTGLPDTFANGSASGAVMSADGRWVYFDSYADNLVPGDTNQATDLFRHDLWTGRVERISLTRDGGQSDTPSYDPFVDATGSTVIFDALDGNLVPEDTNTLLDVYLRHL